MFHSICGNPCGAALLTEANMLPFVSSSCSIHAEEGVACAWVGLHEGERWVRLTSPDEQRLDVAAAEDPTATVAMLGGRVRLGARLEPSARAINVTGPRPVNCHLFLTRALFRFLCHFPGRGMPAPRWRQQQGDCRRHPPALPRSAADAHITLPLVLHGK